jgi:hypothetical protein
MRAIRLTAVGISPILAISTYQYLRYDRQKQNLFSTNGPQMILHSSLDFTHA